MQRVSATFLLLSAMLFPSLGQSAALPGRGGDATHVLVLNETADSAFWTDYNGASASAKPLMARAGAATDRLVQVTCHNDDATDSLFVLFKPGADSVTTDALEIKAGEWFTAPIYMTNATTVSVRGAGDGTPFRCVLLMEQQ